ncbi:hypothetical protein PDE_06216 [Penicillium oxalicum 114-2]|uniref:Uncharacterized protein n=1 Tax=Penicillium oxalicum (strain 114-2 / CGMCC 5302) TaxID=933388 RepID=S7ZRH7_PENO1|nr:hypothetical protein PDE_06216 [Penicillium oxalicum 114-2]
MQGGLGGSKGMDKLADMYGVYSYDPASTLRLTESLSLLSGLYKLYLSLVDLATAPQIPL